MLEMSCMINSGSAVVLDSILINIDLLVTKLAEHAIMVTVMSW